MGKLAKMGYKGREEKGMFNKDKGFNNLQRDDT